MARHTLVGEVFAFPPAVNQDQFHWPGRNDVHEDQVTGYFLWVEVPVGIRPQIIYGQTRFHKDQRPEVRVKGEVDLGGIRLGAEATIDDSWVTVKGGVDAGWCRFYGEDTIVDANDERLAWRPPGHMAKPHPSRGKWFAGMTFKHWAADLSRDARIYVEYDDLAL